ncbi:hypothetical protein EON83_26035 [bacterium]|nr:MAG: hypothetical protein EON83_26035 [bacterium]
MLFCSMSFSTFIPSRCLGVAGAALLALSAVSARADVAVTNIATNTTLRYPVALLEGSSDAPENSKLTVVNRTSKKSSRNFETTTVGGRFKALTELVPGRNTIVLNDGKKSLRFFLTYEPMTTPYIVRMIYVTDAAGNTKYSTPKANDPQDYKAKLNIVAKLMQTATAESLNAAGLGRRTFRLETDANGDVIVHTVNSGHPASYYHAFSDDQVLYREVNNMLVPQFPTTEAKNVVLMGFSEYDAVKRRGLSHTALGGGGQGLFGSLDMFSWPSTLQQVQPIFNDNTPVDPTVTFDDSGNRGRMWGLSATTIGATLHELGHALGLPHSTFRYSVMSRGFDQINRMFSLTEPVKAPNAPPLISKPEETATFDRVSSDRLAFTHWFEMDKKGYTKLPSPKIQVDGASGKVVINAPAGVRFVGVDRDAYTRDSKVYPDAAPQTVEFTREELARMAGGDGFSVLVIDNNANQANAGGSEFANPANFIHNWKLSESALVWPDSKLLPEVDAAEAENIVGQLAARPAQNFAPAYVDLQERYAPLGATDMRRVFALSEITSEQEQKVTLLTGSDDALRVWVNGQPVLSKLTMRGATPDEDATPITLRAGRNTLLLEVLNGSEGWGFFARLATSDKARQPLVVNAAGQVVTGK